MRRAGRLPDDLFSAYRAMLDDPCYGDQPDALRAATAEESDDRHDKHPGLAARLKALAACESGDDERDRRPTLELVPDHENLLKRTGPDTRRPGAKAIPWRLADSGCRVTRRRRPKRCNAQWCASRTPDRRNSRRSSPETEYFRSQQTMLNFRVRDLDAMLAQPRAKGANMEEETQEMEEIGRFGWVTEPEGNRIELWQPV
jgi:hypothetical protein